MKITNALVASLLPCTNRYSNYLKFYDNKTHTLGQFMGLKNISHEDKLWVCLRLMPKPNLRFCAADIAELVLPIFESVYPNDPRPRLAIEAARDEVLNYDAVCATGNAAYAAYVSAYVSANAVEADSKVIILKQIRSIILKYMKRKVIYATL